VNQVATTGPSIVITKRGMPVAKLVPLLTSEPEFGCMQAMTKMVGDIVAPTGEQWDADA